MQFTALLITLLATAVVANPVKRTDDKPTSSAPPYPTSPPTPTKPPGGDPTSPPPAPGPYDPCTSGLFDVAQCCATDVGGIADLDCQTPDTVPSSPANFEAICATGGQRARCCILPILGQDVLCTTPLGLGR